MKKLAILLIASMILISSVLAESVDPIVGVWYMDLEVTDDMPTNPYLEGYTRCVVIVTFESSGDLSVREIDYTPSEILYNGETSYSGKWSKNGGQYITKIMGAGQSDAYIKNGSLHIKIYSSEAYYVLHKMEIADWYYDIHR